MAEKQTTTSTGAGNLIFVNKDAGTLQLTEFRTVASSLMFQCTENKHGFTTPYHETCKKSTKASTNLITRGCNVLHYDTGSQKTVPSLHRQLLELLGSNTLSKARVQERETHTSVPPLKFASYAAVESEDSGGFDNSKTHTARPRRRYHVRTIALTEKPTRKERQAQRRATLMQ